VRPALVATAAALALLLGPAGSSSHQPHDVSVILSPPAGAGQPVIAAVFGVDCPPGGGCWAAGDYELADELTKPMVVARVSGRWRRGLDVAIPLGADASSYASLTSVGCLSSRSCVAVGTYTAASGEELAMASLELHGQWERATRIPLPADAADAANAVAYASGVSCSDTSCTIVGTYSVRSGGQRGFAEQALFTGNAGLRRAIAPSFRMLPSFRGARTIYESLSAVSCSNAATCEVVGEVAGLAMTQREQRGHWAPEVLAPVSSAGAVSSSLDGIACTSVQHCIAVGAEQGAGDDAASPLVDSLSGNTWTWAGPVAAPSSMSAALLAVSCSSTRSCIAVGVLSPSTSSLVTSSHAAISSGTINVLPKVLRVALPNAGPGAPNAESYEAISCSSSATCVALGDEAQSSGHVTAFSHPIATALPATAQ
jgi:hypothetical protein